MVRLFELSDQSEEKKIQFSVWSSTPRCYLFEIKSSSILLAFLCWFSCIFTHCVINKEKKSGRKKRRNCHTHFHGKKSKVNKVLLSLRAAGTQIFIRWCKSDAVILAFMVWTTTSIIHHVVRCISFCWRFFLCIWSLHTASVGRDLCLYFGSGQSK